MFRTIIILAISLLFASASWAQKHQIELKPGHPSRYEVKSGDTLWGISEQFLKYPWDWQELWNRNDHLGDPHKIYPGDVLVLHYVDGQPQIEVEETHEGGVVKLSPKTRYIEKQSAIPAIPMNDIKPFLNGSRVLTKEQIDNAPYIVSAADEHLFASVGFKIYVRGIKSNKYTDYSIFEKNGKYTDPVTKAVLGYKTIQVGNARLTRLGDPATLVIVENIKEILRSNILLPRERPFSELNIIPKCPKTKVDAEIIDVLGGVSQIGQYDAIVINRGKSNGVRTGDILSIFGRGEMVKDTKHSSAPTVKLPDEHIGDMMIFRTFAKVSYGLVMDATGSIHTLDRVINPVVEH